MHPTLFLLSFRLPQPGSNFVQYKFRNIMDLSDITRLISSLRAQTARDSITPNGLGSILQRIVDAISSMSGIDVEDEEAILQRLSAAESNASTALQAAQNAQAGAAGNVIDSFTQSQDEDEVSLSIKQHGLSAKQVVLPAASSTGAGIMTATDKSHLDTAYGKRINLMSAPSSESVVTLTITFGDGTTKSVTFVGATAGTGGRAGLMTKEQADQLAALVAAGAAENVRDDAGYIKQQYAAPVILRNVSDETVDDLSVGDIFYDAGKLWQCGTTETINMGDPSKKVIYYCLADQTLYRWTGSRFVQAVSISSGDVAVPTKLSDLINDMGFLTAHQPLKTINGQTITGTGNITIDGAAELKDASSHIKQSVATPVVLRNVTDATLDDLNIGDVFYDSGLLWCVGANDNYRIGTPSKQLIFFCLTDQKFYRWTGSRFAAINSSADIVALNGVSSNQDGTIVFTDTAGNTYTVNLNHTHENMAKLIVCEESDLPSTLAKDTIYAQVDDATDPGEIEKLWIAGLEFVGGGGASDDTPRLITPRDGLTLDFDGQSTIQLFVRGKNLLSDLSLSVSGDFTVTDGNGTAVSTITATAANDGVALLLTKGSNYDSGTLRIFSSEVDVTVALKRDISLPAGYSPLEAVSPNSLSLALSATNIQVYSSWRIVVRGSSSSSNAQVVICQRNTAPGRYFGITSVGKWGVANAATIDGINVTDKTEALVEFGNSLTRLTIGGNTVTVAPQKSDEGGIDLFGCSIPDHYYFSGYVYEIECVSGGYFHAIPAKRLSDNTVGLYDVRNDVFYTGFSL